MAKVAALIRGDGVGPELSDVWMNLCDVLRSSVKFVPVEAGFEWWQRHGGPSLIPQETWDVLKKSDACLKAPTTTPWERGMPRSVAVSIRQGFDLYANVRPIRTFKGLESKFGHLDFVCVREATEGLYTGIDVRLSDDCAIAIRKISRKQSTRVARKAFEIAKSRGWSKVIVITKRNIMKECDGLFWECVEAVAKDFPGISYEEYFIDNMAQQLVKNPDRFNQNVLLSTNLFMDVLSEEAAGLVASIGCIYSANLGDSYAMFEPAHGSAPKYKGMNKVNPTAMILSGAWLLEYLGDEKVAKAIFEATEAVIVEGKKVTYDLGGTAKMTEMTEAIAEKALQILGK